MILKVFSKLGLAENFLNLRRHLSKFTDFMFNSEKWKDFPLWMGEKNSCSLLFDIVLETLERAGSLDIEMHRSKK